MWGRICSSFRISYFTCFGEFMISFIIYIVHYIIGQSSDYVYELLTLVCLPGLV